MRSLQIKYSQAEETTAANEEAKLCLQKCSEGSWGVVGDYRSCVKSVAEGRRGGVRLRIDACFASSDVMIGKGGQRFFEECWRQEGVGEGVDYEGATFEGTNHDTVLTDSRHGALRDCLESLVRGFDGEEGE